MIGLFRAGGFTLLHFFGAAFAEGSTVNFAAAGSLIAFAHDLLLVFNTVLTNERHI